MEDEKYLLLQDIKFIRGVCEKSLHNNSSYLNFSLGIFYGLFFAIISNLFILLLYESKIEPLSGEIKFYILIALILIILISLIIFLIENKKFKRLNNKLDRIINETEIDREKIVSNSNSFNRKELIRKYLLRVS